MSKGSPIITLRLPAPVFAGLKQLAERLETTPSELIRADVIAMLNAHGIDYSQAQLPGQMRIDTKNQDA